MIRSSSDFPVVMIVVAGDTHIPHRAERIPEGFFDVLRELDPDYLVLTGDYTEPSVLELFRAKRVVAVRGNMDRFELPLEEHIDLAGGRTIGAIHGHQIYPRGDKRKLYRYAEERGRKILLHGHTHKFSVDVLENRLLVNPGTLTGARGGLSLGPNPKTFATLEVYPNKRLVIVERREAEEEEFDKVGTRKIKL